MSDEDNKSVVRRLEEGVFNQGRLELADDLVAADAVNHSPLPGELPGPEGIRQTYAIMKAAFEDFHVTVEQLLAERDMVAERLTISGTHTGEYLSIPPTGRRFSVEELNIYRVAQGKIAERWGVVDQFGILNQLQREYA
jgi:predicted ester cyclase